MGIIMEESMIIDKVFMFVSFGDKKAGKVMLGKKSVTLYLSVN
jgi:hypothetical protein